MVDISSENNQISINVSTSGNKGNVNATPDLAKYYSNLAQAWATKIDGAVNNTDYSAKYYANESKKQADISTAKTTEVVEIGNTAVSNIENARDNAIIDVNTAGATQVALATEQATIAINKASEVVESGNEALSNIDTAKDNAITSITNQETTSKNVLIDEGVTQIGLIQNEGATQIANVQSTGFYMRDDKLYFINSQGEEVEFKDAGGIDEQLAGKVDLDAHNLSAEGKSLISGYGMPSSRYIDLTLGASDTYYTAPANGWFCLAKTSNAASQYINIYNDSNGMGLVFRSTSSGAQLGKVFIPAAKNQRVNISYTVAGNTSLFRFIYAQGSESEAQ